MTMYEMTWTQPYNRQYIQFHGGQSLVLVEKFSLREWWISGKIIFNGKVLPTQTQWLAATYSCSSGISFSVSFLIDSNMVWFFFSFLFFCSLFYYKYYMYTIAFVFILLLIRYAHNFRSMHILLKHFRFLVYFLNIIELYYVA